MAEKEKPQEHTERRIAKVELRKPVQDGFFSGMGFIVGVLLTALITVVVYIFYLTFLI